MVLISSKCMCKMLNKVKDYVRLRVHLATRRDCAVSCLILTTLLCLVPLVILAFVVRFKMQQTDYYIMYIDTQDDALFTVDEKFLSLGLDSTIITDGFPNFNMSLCPIEFYHEQFSERKVEHDSDEIATGLTIRDILPEDPSKYDKMRPPKRDGNPTKVFFHVTVMGLDSIDENSMTYAADIFFAQTWKDHRLRLPENMTTEYRLLEVDWLKNMWRPDSFFKNAKSVTFQTMTIPNHYMWLYKDKTILYMVKLTLRLSCAMNFMIYPHDTQECKLQMESLSHTTDDMVFQWDPDVPLVVDENIELPQLALVKNHTADCTQVYSTGNFTCLEVVFQLKRRLGYYLFHTYIPTCLIVIMSWVSFWIKPEAAPARVTLGVTSLLTLSTQHAKSQAGLPPVSYLKAVDAFMSACTVFVFMALMEYCLVNIVLGDSDLPQPPPEKRKSTTIFDMPPAKPDNPLLLATGPSPPLPPDIPVITAAQKARNHAIMIDRFSRIFFPLLFTILNLSYWIMFAEYI